ncbi:bifunctional acetate--CoA ligase family protein/GNAT family N-acetyltransferase [Acuticoccus sediminis]|uniref:bifunctional acetate--CoA ligase family protein/GNAT family N-acetyltransferase n=1 Tax=Acuticoccus sediminis TaxID=2184697 RepID=UPI001CFD9F50|nr:bifunctional acetate--CoA ligase family protein/GNAT family N-acetyltransferase [Acuticoccus sediminis]
MTVRNLEYLLEPRSVVLIGASNRRGSLGGVVLRRLTGAGFRGSIGLVNPKYKAIGDQPCYPSVMDLPFVPDLGVIVAPATAVPGLIHELGEKGARAAVVITAGVTGTLRQEMLDAAKPFTLRIMGPNCVGLQVPHMGLDASFAHLTAGRGHVALLSQSGAIITAMLDWAEARGIGFSTVASLGDMADIDTGDMLDQMAADRQTRAILMYLEGVTNAKKFMSAARSAARAKPVIVIKAGRSASASKAAASHTGALAGADDVYEAAFDRAGVLRVDDLQELFDAAEALARHRPLKGDRLAILTNGGGAGVLAVDALAKTSGRLAELSPGTMTTLDASLPSTWSHGDPVDIIGDAGPDRYEAALEALLAEPEADAILVINCPTGLASSSEAAEAVVATIGRANPKGKPVLATWLGGATATQAAQVLERAGIATHATPRQAIDAFDTLVRHRKSQIHLMRTPASLPPGPEPDREAAQWAIDSALKEGREILSEVEAKAVLAAYGVPVNETRIARTPDEAAALAEQMAEHPLLAIKILSRDITHKSDVGGVQLNLSGPDQVREAAAAMLDRVRKRRPDAHIDGVVVQPMVKRPNAHELLLGISDDATFGPVMLFGAGGTAVEVVKDKALALPPLDLLLAEDMIDRTRIGKLLAGYRDKPAADRQAIALALVHLSQLVADMPQIRELDINPLLADATGVVAVDARIRVAPAERVAPGGNPRLAIRPYPSEWDKPEKVPYGTIQIRPIRPEDEALYPDFLAKVSKEDIRRRFFRLFSTLTHEEIARLTQIDYARAMAFIGLDDDGAMLGVARFAADADYRTAEFAVLVRSDLKGQGIGRALMVRLIEYAASEGIEEMYGDVLSSNRFMLDFVRELGFVDTADPEDMTVRKARLEPLKWAASHR